MLPAFSLVIPAFNEADRIGQSLREVLDYLQRSSPESELIVVNDGSTDETSARVREVFSTAGLIATRLLEHSPNRGKGAAVRQGLLAATKPIGLFSDADLSTPIEETPKLLEPIAAGEIDIAFGSRALASRAGAFSICSCAWRRVFLFGIRSADSRPFASTSAGRF